MAPDMKYASALEWLAASRGRGILPGLSRISHLLAILGNPQDGLLLVHVAGTNGKGSTCAFLESALRAAGMRTGFFSSPWLLSPTEMFRVQGVPVSRKEFAAAVAVVAHASSAMGVDPGAPTEYEAYAAMAFWLFRRAGCEVVVLETCMGGRFDTTNAYAGGNLAVLTGISLDHTGFLGTTLGEIAWHKAGIFRTGFRAVTCVQQAEVLEVIRACAAEVGTDVSVLSSECITGVGVNTTGTDFTLSLPEGAEGAEGVEEVLEAEEAESSWNGRYHLRLIGAHQAVNAALAVHALHALHHIHPDLPLTAEAIRSGLSQTQWPCRFEVFEGSPTIILDGAHNPDGMARCVETFRQVFPGRRATVMLGVLRDKDVAGMLRPLMGIADHFVLLAPESPRALPVDALQGFVEDIREECGFPPVASENRVETLPPGGCCTLEKSDTMKKAFTAGLRATPGDGVLLAVGSLTWIGHFRNFCIHRR